MLIVKRTHAAVMAALLAPFVVFAQTSDAPPPEPTAVDLTSLNKVVEYALINNPEVQARYQDFRSALEGQNVARGGLLPQVNANGWIGREFRNHTHGATPSDSYNWGRPGYSLELRQLLFDGFSTYNTYKQAGYDKLARFFDLMATSDNTAYAAVQAYIDTQRFRELEALARENYMLHEDTLKQIRDRSASGVGRGVDLEQAGGRLALAQTNLMTESANLNDVEARFARIVTAPPSERLDPVPEVAGALPEKPSSFEDSLRSNPTILSRQASLQAAEKGVYAAKGAFSPTIEFVAATGTDRQEPSREYRDLQSSSVSLQGRWNLYRGGSDIARVRQTTAQQYAARDLRDYACRNVQQDLSTAWNNIANLRAQLPFLRDHAISAAKVRDAYRQQFQIGQRTLLDLLDTENERFEAARALANAQYDLLLAQYRWLALSHKILPSLQLAQLDSSDELPDEASGLALTDEVIKMCSTKLPDTSRLEPVAVKYNEGDKPPTLTPSTRGKAAPAPKW